MTELHFLLVEDSPLDVELIQATLRESGMEFNLTQVSTRADFTAALTDQSIDLILSDYSLPDFDGIAALALAQQYCPQVPFIFVSATLGEELAIETLKSGATDYVLKQRLGRLVPAVQRALRESQERQNRVRMEAALQSTEDRYRLLFEQSPLGVLLIRLPDQAFIEFNTQAHQQLGYTRDEFAQLTLGDLEAFDPSPVNRVDSPTCNSEQFETKHRTKTGELRDVLVTAQRLTMDEKDYVHTIFQDITERKQAEQTLREHNERLKLLYETTSDLLSTQQPIALLDEVFQKLAKQIDLHFYFNFLAEEVEGRCVLRLAAYSGISPMVAATIRQLDLGQAVCGQVAVGRQPIVLDQATLANHAHANLLRRLGITAYAGLPMALQGRLLGTLSFASLTRSHFTPEELDLMRAIADQMAVAIERASLLASLQQQTERLRQANHIKDEFLAVLSHELRTPLNPILGWARLLQSRQYDPATTARALETIERNAKIQTQLIEDLLDVSRILRGKLSLTVTPVDLIATVEAALDTIHLAAEAKGVAVQLHILDPAADSADHPHSNSGFTVLGDASRLQQVIWNLLSNAVKFTPAGGQIEVQLERVQNGEPRDHRTVAQITVSDTGKGISPDFLPHVFDYFRQADGSTTRSFGGLGLGLAIVRHLVELHGGTIQAASAGEGQGATFTVRLPLLTNSTSPDQTEPPLSTSTSAQPLTGLRILIVDDEPDALDWTQFWLEQCGAVVTAVSSAQAALEELEQSQPDVLLSDIGMPEADGLMLLQQIRSRSDAQGSRVPAIALTAYARDEDSSRALLAGFQRHLAKPVEPAHLVTTILELLREAP
jgi:PAS domain S-box-containing protein